MSGIAAFVLAGGRVEDMGVLTQQRAKAALPVAGSYRFIDFAMSNLAASGIERVGVISQYRPSSLMDHVGMGEAWGLIGRGRSVNVLSPYQATTAVQWYRGTADAVLQNLQYHPEADRILVVSGDHIYRMDYGPLIDAHEKSGADLTMVLKRFEKTRCSRFGNARLDASGRVLEYVEKPAIPISNLGSLTIYLFERKALEDALRRVCVSAERDYHIYSDVVPAMVEGGRVGGIVFDGYWAYARNVDDYFRTSMELLDDRSGFALGQWGILTNTEQSGIGNMPPAFVGPDAEVDNCWLSAGCRVEGKAAGSVLSPGVVVEAGAMVEECVLMHGPMVRSGSVLRRVVADKHVLFEKDCQVGRDRSEGPNRHAGEYHRSGISVLGREVIVGAKAVIGAGCQVAPDVELSPGAVVPDFDYIFGKEKI